MLKIPANGMDRGLNPRANRQVSPAIDDDSTKAIDD
jgi:hypothetical protein